MLYEVKTLKNYSLCSLNGEIGKAKEFYFDDHHWTVRYLVADTGKWLMDKKVLLSPYALNGVSKVERCISINLTKKQIENSPSPASDKPVSRQFEDEYYKHFGWPVYYFGSDIWGRSPLLIPVKKAEKERNQEKERWDSQLRSTHDVSGCKIEALDGEVGIIEDFIIDDKTWEIRYLIVDTKDWWPGKRILVAPQWIENVNWGDSKIFVNILREPFKNLPEYTMDAMLTREYESRLYQSCNRQVYWVDEPSSKK